MHASHASGMQKWEEWSAGTCTRKQMCLPLLSIQKPQEILAETDGLCVCGVSGCFARFASVSTCAHFCVFAYQYVRPVRVHPVKRRAHAPRGHQPSPPTPPPPHTSLSLSLSPSRKLLIISTVSFSICGRFAGAFCQQHHQTRRRLHPQPTHQRHC